MVLIVTPLTVLPKRYGVSVFVLLRSLSVGDSSVSDVVVDHVDPFLDDVVEDFRIKRDNELSHSVVVLGFVHDARILETKEVHVSGGLNDVLRLRRSCPQKRGEVICLDRLELEEAGDVVAGDNEYPVRFSASGEHVADKGRSRFAGLQNPSDVQQCLPAEVSHVPVLENAPFPEMVRAVLLERRELHTMEPLLGETAGCSGKVEPRRVVFRLLSVSVNRLISIRLILRHESDHGVVEPSLELHPSVLIDETRNPLLEKGDQDFP